jgi:hypothetical protein
MYWVVMHKVNTYRVEVETNHATVIKYAAYWRTAGIYCTCCAIFNIVDHSPFKTWQTSP